jgi:hypothetical protein
MVFLLREGWEQRKTATDESGRFEFDYEESAGPLRLVAFANTGFSLASVDVLASAAKNRVELRFGTTLDVSGTVENEEGIRIDGAEVSIDGITAGLSAPSIPPVYPPNPRTRSRDGRFEFPDLDDLEEVDETAYMIICEHPDYERWLRIGKGRELLTSPVVIVLKHPQEPLRLSGSVQNLAGDPVEGAEIAILFGTSNPGSTQSDSHGLFDLAVTPSSSSFASVQKKEARLLLRVRKTGYAPFDQVLSLGADFPTRVDVTLEPGGHISGRVVDHTGEPVEDVTVLCYDPKTANKTGALIPFQVQTDAQGSFAFADLDPLGEYNLATLSALQGGGAEECEIKGIRPNTTGIVLSILKR